MVVKYGIQTDREICEGWTIQDFIDEIDMLFYDTMMGKTIRRVPKDINDMSNLIRDLIPKGMFHTQYQEDIVVRDLTQIYSRKWGYDE